MASTTRLSLYGIGIAILVLTTALLMSEPAKSQSSGSFVALQAASPGTAQGGHTHITGNSRASQFIGGGSQLTSLNGTNIASGTIADIRLSSNVALLSGTQSFSGSKTFSAAPTFSAVGMPFNVSSSSLVSNLNVGLLNGQNASFYQNAGNLNAGTIPTARIPVPLVLSGTSTTFGIVQGTNTASNGVYGVVGEIFGGTGLGYGIYGLTNRTTGSGVFGFASSTTGTTNGVYGRSDSQTGYGVYGAAQNSSGAGRGVYGYAASSGGTGVYGEGANSGYGVYAKSTTGTAVYGIAQSGIGISGYGSTYGGAFVAAGNNGIGAYGQAVHTSIGYGLRGDTESSSGAGVLARTNSVNSTAPALMAISASTLTSATGVYGEIGPGYAIYGKATSGTGVFGQSTSGYGAFFTGVRGIRAVGTTSTALEAIASGTSDGITSSTTNGRGIYSESGGGIGIQGQSSTSNGVAGFSTSNDAVFGQTFTTGKSSVFGYTNTVNANGGYFNSASGTPGHSGVGVVGQCASSAGYGVYASGNLGVSALKLFVIDHPKDPENMLLQHYCSEGPEPINSYSGAVLTDAKGFAVVRLPDYFEAINKNPRISLTVVDDSDDFVMVKVTQKVLQGQFRIRTSKPRVEVFWRVDATRFDRYVQQNGYSAEKQKPEHWRGKYLDPRLYDEHDERGVFYSVPQSLQTR